MYNNTTTMEKTPKPFIIEELTPDEVSKLKQITTGYGMIRRFSRELGMHENTLRGVMLRGSGKPETIKLIRKKLKAA